MFFELNIITALLMLLLGFFLLCKGADWLVDGAVALASALGVSTLVIGLTVVSMGTSAPEVAASIVASLKGEGSVAMGNVFGSNIANLFLIGGCTAIVRPIIVRLRVLRFEIPVMILTGLFLLPIIFNRHVSRIESLALVAVFAILLMITVLFAKRETVKGRDDLVADLDHEPGEKIVVKKLPVFPSVFLILIGLLGLVIGARMTIEGAVYVGEFMGLSKAAIGLTIIAFGTSLPELITCIIAALKGHDDISVGNLVGSNIFNTLLVVGAAGLANPFTVETNLVNFDFPVMMAVSIGFLVVGYAGRKISRSDGVLMLVLYVMYIMYLFLMRS